jgi:hypothetical protein
MDLQPFGVVLARVESLFPAVTGEIAAKSPAKARLAESLFCFLFQ